MIKKYNQFIKRINEAGEEQAPAITPAPAPAIDPKINPSTPDKKKERYKIDRPAVEQDPLAKVDPDTIDYPDPIESTGEGVEDNLEYLHDTLEGSELMNNILKYKGHEITLPSETEQFEVDGVRRIKREGNKLVPTSSSEDVIEYLNNPDAQAEAQGNHSKRSQAQAQRGSQAQYENLETQDDEDDIHLQHRNMSFDDNLEEDEFETQTGKDPESEALSGEKVDVEETGRKRQAQFESKSYKSRFRTKF